MDVKTFFLGLALVLMPILVFVVCALVGAQLIMTCHSYLALLSEVLLGALSFLPIVKIYKHTGWVFGCKMSATFTLLVVLSGFFIGLGYLDYPC
ncbi:iron transporter [Helicobacter vulpis]|uniref:iron transporter n=1 Tax=Helicobacter vulpis TaxID=2316076 RepID=UPI000EAC93E2|nr:iron transporter [Helicobacter vulpis]